MTTRPNTGTKLSLFSDCVSLPYYFAVKRLGALMRLSRALEEKLMDVRLRDKLISEGKVTKQQVADFLNSLSDDQTRAMLTNENGRDESLRQSQ
jgi:hypothetical protein